MRTQRAGLRRLAPLAIAVVAVGCGVAAAACSSSSSGAGDGASATTAAGGRAAAGEVSRIEHVVVLMQDNRIFEQYFGQLKEYAPNLDVESEPADASNPDPTNPDGPPIVAFHQTNLCEVADLDHSWNGTHREFDGGAMDGFTRQNVAAKDPTGSRAMGYYTEQELPFYYALFSTFAIGDRYFAPTLTRTIPNRLYLLAGTSFGHIENDLPKAAAEFSQRSIFNLLDEGGVSWKVYYSDLAVANEFAYVRNDAKTHVVPIAQYFADAQAGSLPQVAFIDPKFGGSKNAHTDEHPPSNVQVGEKFSADVINALFGSPDWGSAALFLTYDEHGGYYDHVAPPSAPAPDDAPPPLKGTDEAAGFDHYGVRVPVVVVSPFARRSFVSHVAHDHTSILRFIETRFGLPSLTARDAAADPMYEFFTFQHPNLSVPSLPDAPLDLNQIITCQKLDLNRRSVGF